MVNLGTCLLIHGFTGAPFEIEPLADVLRAEGHEIVTPTLAGHGGDRQQMMQVTWRDWINSVEVVLQELLTSEETVHLVGFSMGGLIAAHLAARHGERIRSLTMLSTPIFTINRRQLFRTLADAIQRSMRTGERQEEVTRYIMKVRATPLRSLGHFRMLLRTVKGQLGDVDVPLLVIQGQHDDLVEARSAAYIYEHVKTTDKQLHLFPKSRHLICHDCEADEVMRLVASFIGERDSGHG